MSEEKKASGCGRTRNYATVVYPESAPENWKEILSDLLIPCFVSPLHNADVNPTGEVKKEHYHILFMFDGVKTTEQAKAVIALVGGVGCEVVKSIRGYARYLCHLDNPDKAQYDTEDVICLCGADYYKIIGLAIDKYQAISDIMDFVDDNGITSYRDLLQYCRVHRKDWFRCLCDNGTYVVLEYLKSAEWHNKKIDRFRDKTDVIIPDNEQND
jgi:hypothetical protein